MNKVKIIMDNEKIAKEGAYSPAAIHGCLDDLFLNRKHLRKDGDFYIDDDPYDSAGVIMPCIFILAGKQWFRDYVKEMRWYREVKAAVSEDGAPVFYEEDIKKNLIDIWEEDRRKEGLPVNC